MDKVLVNLYVPSVNEKYDIYIPTFLPISDITPLISKMLEEIQNQKYFSSNHEVLGSIDQKILFSPTKTLKDYNVQNGEHLLFC